MKTHSDKWSIWLAVLLGRHIISWDWNGLSVTDPPQLAFSAVVHSVFAPCCNLPISTHGCDTFSTVGIDFFTVAAYATHSVGHVGRTLKGQQQIRLMLKYAWWRADSQHGSSWSVTRDRDRRPRHRGKRLVARLKQPVTVICSHWFSIMLSSNYRPT